MSHLQWGLLLGLLFGTLACLMMLPLQFADRRRALLSAFCDRFLLGLFVATANLGLPPLWNGAAIGLGMSLPAAILTRATLPILVTGLVFGVLGGWWIGNH